MNKGTYKLLTEKQQFWYANIMIDMVLADGVIHPSEEKYLGLIFQLFAEKPDQIKQLKDKSQRSSPENIQPVKGISSQVAVQILEDCVDAAIADAEFHPKEEALIHEIGKQLQIELQAIEAAIMKGKHQLGHIFAFVS